MNQSGMEVGCISWDGLGMEKSMGISWECRDDFLFTVCHCLIYISTYVYQLMGVWSSVNSSVLAIILTAPQLSPLMLSRRCCGPWASVTDIARVVSSFF